jgi:hypothetical protein
MELVQGLAHTQAVIDFGNDKTLLNNEDNRTGSAVDNNDRGMGVCDTIQQRMFALWDMDRHLLDALQGGAIAGRTASCHYG